MFIPNKTYTVARNVKDYLSQGKIGKVINSKAIAKDIGEPEAAISGALWTFHDEKKLELAHKRGNLHYYKVLPNIIEPRPGDDRKRAKPFTKGKQRIAENNGYEFKVEKGVPMPKRKNIYPFSDMKVGDSFLFPVELRKRVTNAAYKHKQKHPSMDFITKEVGKKSARCWRVK